jgi:hypothetical protein
MSDDFLAGGESLPAVKLTNVGDKVTGVIKQTRKLEDRDLNGELRTWPNGDVKHVFVFDLDTTDGAQALWVRGQMVSAIREAAREAKVSNLVGCTLDVQHHALGEAKQKGYNAPKLYRARITPASTVDNDWI